MKSLNPKEILFSHSNICPNFTGCGKNVLTTLDEIQSGKLRIESLPNITVILNCKGEYISLNNRRLWVIKKYSEMGYLESINVNVKKVSDLSVKEQKRYNNNTYSPNAKFDRRLIRKV